MRKSWMALGLMCLAVAVVVPTAGSKTPKQDSASGSGVREPSCSDSCPSGAFSFNATSGRHGENASGKFFADFGGFASFTGNVTCLHVSGHTATLYGRISKGTGAADPNTYVGDPPGSPPLYFVAVVSDNGTPMPKHPSPDQMSLVGWGEASEGFADPQVCVDPSNLIGTDMFGLSSGNLTVIDR